jgi:serine/threonine protein kinase
MAPDLTLSDFEGVQIKVSDLKFVVKVGEGAQGAVWKADWKGRVVAVKELFPPAGKVSENVLNKFDEFRREVWMMSSLRHDCIVQMLGFCVKPHNLIVMEYIPNGTLYEWISDKKRNLSWPQRIRIAIDVALGLRFLHSASPPLIHRDMKSPNVMVVSTDPRASNVVKLADFGLSSRLYVPALKERTQDRKVGNPHWLAPECMREEEFNDKVDVYSYGMILWELVTREVPYAKEFRENGGQQCVFSDLRLQPFELMCNR